MEKLSYEMLLEACKAGGASALSSITELAPAAGETALVAPAKYINGSNPCYVFETRYIDGKQVKTVLIDARTSAANRVEAALAQAVKENHPILSKMPKIRVTYSRADSEDSLEFTDLTLPHRAFDAHIRFGTSCDDGKKTPVPEVKEYKDARNANPSNARALFDISPITVLLGGWDSSRKTNQARFASCLTGEIIGVVSNDSTVEPNDFVTKRSGARIDPVGAGFNIEKNVLNTIAERSGLSKKNGFSKASELLLGAIPPSTEHDKLDGISVSRIIRSRVLSFATLRSLFFGGDAEADQAIRALLAAIAVNGIARADTELLLRANAHLVEKAFPINTLYERYGKTIGLNALEIAEADAILEEAYEYAHAFAGVAWNGQTFNVEGDPEILKGATSSEQEE